MCRCSKDGVGLYSLLHSQRIETFFHCLSPFSPIGFIAYCIRRGLKREICLSPYRFSQLYSLLHSQRIETNISATTVSPTFLAFIAYCIRRGLKRSTKISGRAVEVFFIAYCIRRGLKLLQ